MIAQRTIRILTVTVILANGLFAGVPAFGATSANRVRILLVADTNGTAAQMHGFGQDRVNLEKALRAAMQDQNLAERYTLDVLEGVDATPAKVLAHYRTLQTEPGDVLFFYYSGHGGTDQTHGHYLAMAAGNLYRTQIRAAMLAHNPRLLVLLTDCCADFGPGIPSESGTTQPEQEIKLVRLAQDAPKPARQGALVRQMLFQQKGVVDVNACQPGKASDSKYYRGGFFTFTMIRLLSAHPHQFGVKQGGVVRWHTFFVVLQNETLRDVTAAARAHQVPVAFAVTTEVEGNH
jgi:hypothetical protein